LSIIRDQVLEAIARKVIKEYDPTLLESPQAIPVEEIMENRYGLVIVYQRIRKNGKILGETAFDDTWVPVYDAERHRYIWLPVQRGTVVIEASLLDGGGDGRLRFTLAHELAHWLIHQDTYAGSGLTAAMHKNAAKSSESDDAIERQADRLGCSILMPTGQVKMGFYKHRNNADAVGALAALFGVSKQAMSIRLRELKLK
jgi:hypothetical protein